MSSIFGLQGFSLNRSNFSAYSLYFRYQDLSLLASTSTPENASTNCLLLPYDAFKAKHERFLNGREGSLTYYHLLGDGIFHWFSGHAYHNLSFCSGFVVLNNSAIWFSLLLHFRFFPCWLVATFLVSHPLWPFCWYEGIHVYNCCLSA